MKKKKRLSSYYILTGILLLSTILLSTTREKINLVRSNVPDSDYQIVLNANNTPLALSDGSVVALVEDMPDRYVIWAYENTKKTNTGHVLLQGDATNFGVLRNIEPINGILGVDLVVGNSATVQLLAAYSLDGYYKLIHTFDATHQTFEEIIRQPYLKFLSEDAAEEAIINQIVVNYSCVPHTPVADIDFGADPFNGTAATGAINVGVALYYDASEDGQQVASNQVEFTIANKNVVEYTPTISYLEKLDIYYYRSQQGGDYTLTLTVTDSQGLKAVRTRDINVSSNHNDNNINRAIYQSNIATQLDYPSGEPPLNEWVVIGKDFTVFQRVNSTRNFASAFIPSSRFEGGQPLTDFTISFKYTTLNTIWKLLFSFWTGDIGIDAFGGDYLRVLTNRNAIGIQGDTQENSLNKDEGEATGIPLKEGPVWIKFTRQITNTNTATFKLYTSTDGITYTLKTTSVINKAGTGAGGAAAKVTGFLPFSIDNDFIISQLSVSGTVFTV